MHRPIHLMLALLLTLLGSMVGPSSRASDRQTRLTVVTTIAQITDLVRTVAGDRATVIGLMGEGVDPHLYQPTRSDIASLLRADIVFYNGLHLEGKMTEVFDRLKRAEKPVHAVVERIAQEDLLSPEDFEGAHDPHVWMNPQLWISTVEFVCDELSAIDPEGRSVFRENTARYVEQLRELDAYARQVLETVPEQSRVLVTAHDAFNYFGEHYGFDVLGIQGISTESEAGVRHITRLVDTLVSRRVSAVFIETTVADRNINALIAGAGSKGHAVTIGGELFSDAMGKPGSYEGTYIGMIDHNVTTITRALGGKAPERGMQGLLGTAGK